MDVLLQEMKAINDEYDLDHLGLNPFTLITNAAKRVYDYSAGNVSDDEALKAFFNAKNLTKKQEFLRNIATTTHQKKDVYSALKILTNTTTNEKNLDNTILTTLMETAINTLTADDIFNKLIMYVDVKTEIQNDNRVAIANTKENLQLEMNHQKAQKKLDDAQAKADQAAAAKNKVAK